MTVRKARTAVASDPDVEAVAEELLVKGNAVDAVVAGVFAACAISPNVLLGPVQVLVGGAGAGLLALDGRVRQPGIGAPRPRGFMSAEEIPDAARVGVPWLPATMSAALASMGTATFNQVLAPAIALAKRTPRAEVLKRIAARGPRAIEESPIASELVAAAGRPAGGLLTMDDLSSPRPDVQKASRRPMIRAQQDGDAFGAARGSSRDVSKTELSKKTEAKLLVTLPWTHIEGDVPVPPAEDADIARVRAVVAVDRNASFAIACWDEATDGLLLTELGLRAPFRAEPVRRGQTRVRPGEPRAAAGSIALLGTGTTIDIALAAFGASDAYDVLAQAIQGLIAEDRIEARGEARLVALSHAHGAASALRG